MKEIWKDIEGYAGYQISSLGNIRSVDRYVASKNGSKRLLKGQPIPPIIRGEGDEVAYIAVLRKNGKQTHCSLRKLVASAFVDNQKIIKTCGISMVIDTTIELIISSGGEQKTMMMR